MKFKDIPQYTSIGNYSPNVRLSYFIEWLDEQVTELGLQLNPDFQRGHVWTEQQQIKYIEHLLRGGTTARTLYFNHPNWMGNWKGEFVCVDGLQRITAIQRFMYNEIPAFGAYLDEYEDKDVMLRKIDVFVNVNNLKTRKEVLQWYYEMNSGGTPHTEEELKRIKRLITLEENRSL
jgi:uncharacterized protein with ParB-like and HNH nuclease domain